VGEALAGLCQIEASAAFLWLVSLLLKQHQHRNAIFMHPQQVAATPTHPLHAKFLNRAEQCC
jgi:hypothetical protein